jgi:hypothetical protein
MNWGKALGELLVALLDYFAGKAAEPKPLNDVNTPKSIRDRFVTAMRARLDRMRGDKDVRP